MNSLHTYDQKLDELLSKVKVVNNYLESHFSNNSLFSYKQLSNLNEWEIAKLAEGVYSYRLPSVLSMIFPTTFESNAELLEHYHDCVEIIYIKSGSLFSTFMDRWFTEKQTMTIPAYKTHNLIAGEEGCEIYVEFLPPRTFTIK